MIRPRLALPLALLALVTAARADVIPPGMTSVEHEIRVELGAEFPGTSFVVFPTDGDAPWVQRERTERGVAVITSATPEVRFTRFAEQPRLWAVQGPLPDKREEITRGWLTQHGAVSSPHVFRAIRLVRDAEGVRRIRTVFRVAEVTATGVRLVGVSEERLAPDGTVKARSVPSVGDADAAPEPGPDRRSGWLDLGPQGGLASTKLDPGATPALALSIAGAALGLLVVRRRRPEPAA